MRGSFGERHYSRRNGTDRQGRISTKSLFRVRTQGKKQTSLSNINVIIIIIIKRATVTGLFQASFNNTQWDMEETGNQ